MEDYPKMMMMYESGLDYKTTMDTCVRNEALNDTLGTNISCTFTYVQANNQAIRDQKPIKNVQPPKKKNENENENTPKSHKKLKNFTKRWVKRIYDSPPTLKSHNVLIGSRGDTTQHQNTKSTKQRLLNETQV